MKTTIDATGRVVIPAAARTQLALVPGQKLDVRVDGGVIEMEPVPLPIQLVEEDGLLVMDAGDAAIAVDDDDVRRVIDADRERRARRHA